MQSSKTNLKKMRYLSSLFTLLLTLLFLAQAQETTKDTDVVRAITPSQNTTQLRVLSAVDSLIADGQSKTTLIALLSTDNGSPIENERIRFILQSGNAFLGKTGNVVAIDAREVGNGVYETTLRSGTVDGAVTVAAVWVSSPTSPLPQGAITINQVTAESLRVETDDKVLLANGSDQATIVAYLLDGLNRPVNNAELSFRLVSGSGSLRQVAGSGNNGRYAAVFTADRTPGNAIIEVSLPTNSKILREQLSLEIVETVSMEVIAFPTKVSRLIGTQAKLENTATLLVPVRDGDGDLVRGLKNTELVAQVVSGPGSITGPIEVQMSNGQRSGVYKFSFVAGETTGTSTIRILNLESPNQVLAEATIETVTQVNASRVDSLKVRTFADEPYYADGASQALVVMFAADRDGNAVSQIGSDLDARIIDGQGLLSGAGIEVNNLVVSNAGTGVYVATLTAGISAVSARSNLRTTFLNTDGSVVEALTSVNTSPLGAPRVVVFPPRLPATHGGFATVDVFDFDSRGLEDLNLQGLAGANSAVRYRVDVEAGPGRMVQAVSNDGDSVDLVADDHLSSASYELLRGTGANQDTVFSIIDLAAAGYPSQEVRLEISGTTELKAVLQPTFLDQGESIQIIAFAQDEFGLPSPGHDMRITVESGSAEVIAEGRMYDDGLEKVGFMDPIANDGMYVGAIRATGTTGDTITLRITDLTSPNQPSLSLTVEVGR